MKRINVVGTSASGKSTFSKALAQQLKVDYIELDELFWLDDWVESSDQEFFKKLQEKINQAPEGYVIDGNYTRTQNIKWKQIDTIIWLDLPFHINFYRSVKRALHRVFTQQPLWINSNNTESFKSLLSRDSIVFWMVKTHRKNREKYLKILNDPQYSDIQFIHLRSTRQMHQFLNGLKNDKTCKTK